MSNKETIKTYLDNLLENNLVTWDGPNGYLKFERRSIFRMTLGTDALSFVEQERMRPSCSEQELPYDEKTLRKLRSLLGS